ncbi:MAG: multicopper oxidase domain-containing protein, partial [Gallionellaceae bacterium]
MRLLQKATIAALTAAALIAAPQAFAKTVKVTMTAMETDVATNGKMLGGSNTMAAWTFDGTVPGKTVRVKEGDLVDFTLVNPATNKNSHAMDFHAAQVSVLDEFAAVKPGDSKHFTFNAKVPGVFMYHCGAGPMVQHIARGM